MNWMNYLKGNGFNIVYALMILAIGLIIAHIVKGWLRKRIRLKSKDPTVKLFIVNVVYALVILVVLISVLGRLGVPTASMITVLGAGSLAIALSLKDSLSHVASGLILIGLKPFHIGDTVEVSGVVGTLDLIGLLNIRIKTANGDHVVIPNSKVFSDKICTKGRSGKRRIDLTIGISYESNIKHAKAIIEGLFTADERILTTPAPVVVVKELADSSVNLAIHPWVQNADYGGVLYALTEQIKSAFDDNNIEIPYPHVEARIKKES